MTQDEKWIANWNAILDFVTANKRRPSKYTPNERNSWNWLRHNQKMYSNGKMNPERIEKFKDLLSLCEQNRRKNQYQ